jgi:hypothetical protein
MVDVLRVVGLTKDDVRNEGNLQWQIADSEWGGINQTPEQFAPALILLSQQQIRTMIDVGTWSAWTAAFYACYLRRFEPTLHIDTIDRREERSAEVRNDPELTLLPITYHVFDTLKHKEHIGAADFAQIDAGHSYLEAKNDWTCYGLHSRCVFFHDVNDVPINQRYRDRGEMTCYHLWQELKASPPVGKRAVELFQHPSGKALMGIGLLLPG